MNYITEKYMGKSPTLLETEKVLGQLLAEIRKDPLKDYTNHPLNIQLQSLITKQFNFKKTFINWIRTPEASPNAMSIFSSDVLIHPVDSIKASKEKGYYGNGRSNAFIIASSTMVNHLNLTDEEYMAILMHELGHSFDISLYNFMNVTIKYITAITNIIKQTAALEPDKIARITAVVTASVKSLAPNILLMTPFGKEVLSVIFKIYERILDIVPGLKKIADIISKVSSTLIRGIESSFSWTVFIAAPIEILISPYYHFIKIPTRKTELFADSFAATYGYGNALSTALSKVSSANLLRTKPYETSIRRIARDLTVVQRDIAAAFVNADHGDTMTRIVSNIQMLKSELNSSDYPPPMKKEIMDQIRSMEETCNNFINANNDERFAMTVCVRKTLYDIFDGRTDFLAKLFPDTKTKWESADTYDDCKLAFYESCMTRHEISEDTLDMLLELYS